MKDLKAYHESHQNKYIITESVDDQTHYLQIGIRHISEKDFEITVGTSDHNKKADILEAMQHVQEEKGGEIQSSAEGALVGMKHVISHKLTIPSQKQFGRETMEPIFQKLIATLNEHKIISSEHAQKIWELEETGYYFSKQYPESDKGFNR